MVIRDFFTGGTPMDTVAVYSTASFKVEDLPPGTIHWTIPDETTGVTIDGPADRPAVRITTTHASVTPRDVELMATFTPKDGGSPLHFVHVLTVFGVVITHADGASPPPLDIGEGNAVTYAARVVPDGPEVDLSWSVGPGERIVIVDQPSQRTVTVRGWRRSVVGRDARLTVTASIGGEVARTTASIGVFGVRIEAGPHDLADRIGVGSTLRYRATLDPPIAEGDVTCRWRASDRLMLRGDLSGPVAEVAGLRGSGGIGTDHVAVDVTWRGSTVSARLAVTVVQVDIMDVDGGPPPPALGVGASRRFQARVTPKTPGMLFWRAGRTATVHPEEETAIVAAVLPSLHEGQDGLQVDLVAPGIHTRALVPVVVFGCRIFGEGGAAPPQRHHTGAPARYVVGIHPEIEGHEVTWSVTSAVAAIVGRSDDRAVTVVGVQEGVVEVQVRVAPRGRPDLATVASLPLVFAPRPAPPSVARPRTSRRR